MAMAIGIAIATAIAIAIAIAPGGAPLRGRRRGEEARVFGSRQ